MNGERAGLNPPAERRPVNAYQKAKVERSLALLRYLQSLALEVREHCKKHVRETLTVCTKELVECLARGELLYVVERKHTNKETTYDAVPFDQLLRDLIATLEQELEVMGGSDAA